MTMMHIDRRTAVKWVLAAGAATQLPEAAFAGDPVAPTAIAGYGKDPNLLKAYAAGDLWPLTLTGAQERTVRVLCDLIIPADERSPAASALGVPQFIDEWISAPYPDCRRDRETIGAGLEWLDAEARRRYENHFAALSAEQGRSICDDICNRSQVQAKFAEGAVFFNRFRELTALGYYTTPIGMKALGYTGNEPLAKFDGPSPEVLKRVGLA
jgi:Gluconate 2-dehydrogenase subunit 3